MIHAMWRHEHPADANGDTVWASEIGCRIMRDKGLPWAVQISNEGPAVSGHCFDVDS